MNPPPPNRKDLLESIAHRIADYRQGEIPPRTPDDVDRWVRQIDASVQEVMLAEMDHVLDHSYLSREYFLSFLRGLVRRDSLIRGSIPWRWLYAALAQLVRLVLPQPPHAQACPTYWRNVRFLDIQKHGASQQEMVRILREVLREKHGLSLDSAGSAAGPFVYLDDILFTGNRIIADVVRWIRTDAPPRADLVVVVIAFYRRGFWYTHKAIRRAATEARKAIRLHWLRALEFEDQPWSRGPGTAFSPRPFRTTRWPAPTPGNSRRPGSFHGSASRPRARAGSSRRKPAATCWSSNCCSPA